MDAFAHCLEAYLSPVFHPMSQGIALEGMRIIKENLFEAFKDGKNIYARAKMLSASSMGSIAFQKGLGAIHSLSHPVGAIYNTHHGLTNAIILPAVLRYNLPSIEEKVIRMAQAMQYEDHSVNNFIENMEKLLDRIKIPKGLNEIGVPEDCIERISKKAMIDTAFGTNPIPAELDDVRELVKISIIGARK